MKRSLLLAVLTAAALASTALAGDVTSTAAPAPAATLATSHPKLVLSSLEHAFGKVKAGEPIAYTFEFENMGDAPLVIEEVKASCGCTKGDFDKLVEPGKSGKITLTVAKTDKYSGSTTKTARVTTNDPDHASFTLTLRADFGADPEGETASTTK